MANMEQAQGEQPLLGPALVGLVDVFPVPTIGRQILELLGPALSWAALRQTCSAMCEQVRWSHEEEHSKAEPNQLLQTLTFLACESPH
jgi:hypothetical protein